MRPRHPLAGESTAGHRWSSPAHTLASPATPGPRRRRRATPLHSLAILLAAIFVTLSVRCGGDSGQPGAPSDSVVPTTATAVPAVPELRINEIQVIGTHNSYHREPIEPLLSLMQSLDAELATTVEYTHRPLREQLEVLGMRQLELDLYADPEGGLFAAPVGPIVAGREPERSPELDLPGFKVLHAPDIDFESSCPTFVSCLLEIKEWSDAHPWHLPLLVLVEVKEQPLPDPFALGFVTPVRVGERELDAIDKEIRSVFPPGQLLTPDDVRGERPTLEEAVLKDGWPTLAESRGRVMFALENRAKREAYLAGHPALEARVMFTNSRPGEADGAFVVLNDALTDRALIRELVERGYLVRTRADADTREARLGDTARRDAALASGAHFVSTDYPVPDPRLGTGYAVGIPDGSLARCNPVTASVVCSADSLRERPP